MRNESLASQGKHEPYMLYLKPQPQVRNLNLAITDSLLNCPISRTRRESRCPRTQPLTTFEPQPWDSQWVSRNATNQIRAVTLGATSQETRLLRVQVVWDPARDSIRKCVQSSPLTQGRRRRHLRIATLALTFPALELITDSRLALKIWHSSWHSIGEFW